MWEEQESQGVTTCSISGEASLLPVKPLSVSVLPSIYTITMAIRCPHFPQEWSDRIYFFHSNIIRFVIGTTNGVGVYVCVCVRVCMFVCVCVRCGHGRHIGGHLMGKHIIMILPHLEIKFLFLFLFFDEQQ